MKLSWFIIIPFLLFTKLSDGKKNYQGEKPAWAKKDIRDYSDADLERLYDQWEEDDEPLEPDELPEHLRPAPKIDLSGLDPSNPEDLLKVSKKGRTLMTFVTVSDLDTEGTIVNIDHGDYLCNPSRDELEEITRLWQTSLMNSHINAERFIIDDNRVIFMFKDGAQAWEAKDYLVEQERMEQMDIENKPYYGKYSSKAKEAERTTKNKEEL